MTAAQYVFGYGSLTVDARASAHGSIPAELPDVRRGWGVAMDNRVELPGYKCYRDAAGARPPVFVCFLDVRPAPGARVNGICRPVDAGELAALDRRERNYERVEVSERFELGARVWTYMGSAAGRARFATARDAGVAVIDAGYLAAVEAGFRALGAAAWAACAPSLDPGGLPVLELVRHELP